MAWSNLLHLGQMQRSKVSFFKFPAHFWSKRRSPYQRRYRTLMWPKRHYCSCSREYAVQPFTADHSKFFSCRSQAAIQNFPLAVQPFNFICPIFSSAPHANRFKRLGQPFIIRTAAVCFAVCSVRFRVKSGSGPDKVFLSHFRPCNLPLWSTLVGLCSFSSCLLVLDPLHKSISRPRYGKALVLE